MDVVIITFPHDISEEPSEATILWFKSRLEKIAGLIVRSKTITITKGTKTIPNCIAFHLTASYQGKYYKFRYHSRFFVQVGHEIMYTSSGYKHLFAKNHVIVRPTKIIKDLFKANT